MLLWCKYVFFLVALCFPYGFLMFSLWFPYVSFDFRVLPKIITRCEGAFCVLLWCKYVFLMVSLLFLYLSGTSPGSFRDMFTDGVGDSAGKSREHLGKPKAS